MKETNDDCFGFNLQTQKLHCGVVLDDAIAMELQVNAGVAFCRAYVVEDRQSGEVFCNMRLRFKDHDSWSRVQVGAHKQHLNRDERVAYLADGVVTVIRTLMQVANKGVNIPESAVWCYHPPEPDDADRTIEWLIAQDLVEITSVGMPDGRKVPVTKGTDSVS